MEKLKPSYDNAEREALAVKQKVDSGKAENYQSAEERLNFEQLGKLNDLDIGPMQKIDAALVYLGHKPATEISLYPWNDPQKKVESTFESMGFEVEERPSYSEGKSIALLMLTRNMETTRQLRDVQANRDHVDYGRLMGYPESAIAAHSSGNTLPDEEYPDMSDLLFKFKLSNNNWREEVELLRKWNEDVKKYLPEVYNGIVESKRSRQAIK